MAKKFEDASFSQEINAIGPVIETEFGYHIVQVLKRTDGQEASYEAVQGRIGAELAAQLRKKNQPAVTAYLRDLEKNADVKYGPMLKRNPYPGETTGTKGPNTPSAANSKSTPTTAPTPAVTPDQQETKEPPKAETLKPAAG